MTGVARWPSVERSCLRNSYPFEVRHHQIDDDEVRFAMAASQALRAVLGYDTSCPTVVRISRYSSSIIGSSSITRILATRSLAAEISRRRG
jgi:hypothetical protein